MARAHSIHSMEHPQSIFFGVSYSVHRVTVGWIHTGKKRRETLLHTYSQPVKCKKRDAWHEHTQTRACVFMHSNNDVHSTHTHECVSNVDTHSNVNVGKQTAKHSYQIISNASRIACVLRRFSRLSTAFVMVFEYWKDTPIRCSFSSFHIPFQCSTHSRTKTNRRKLLRQSDGES